MIKLRSHLLVYWIGFRGKTIWRYWIYKKPLTRQRYAQEVVAAKSQPVEG